MKTVTEVVCPCIFIVDEIDCESLKVIDRQSHK